MIVQEEGYGLNRRDGRHTAGHPSPCTSCEISARYTNRQSIAWLTMTPGSLARVLADQYPPTSTHRVPNRKHPVQCGFELGNSANRHWPITALPGGTLAAMRTVPESIGSAVNTGRILFQRMSPCEPIFHRAFAGPCNQAKKRPCNAWPLGKLKRSGADQNGISSSAKSSIGGGADCCWAGAGRCWR